MILLNVPRTNSGRIVGTIGVVVAAVSEDGENDGSDVTEGFVVLVGWGETDDRVSKDENSKDNFCPIFLKHFKHLLFYGFGEP